MQRCLLHKTVDRQAKCVEVGSQVRIEPSPAGRRECYIRIALKVGHGGGAKLQPAGRVGPDAELTKTLLSRDQIAVSGVRAYQRIRISVRPVIWTRAEYVVPPGGNISAGTIRLYSRIAICDENGRGGAI
jgi:hypothetical protein